MKKSSKKAPAGNEIEGRMQFEQHQLSRLERFEIGCR
jgi:hypothetical protein